MAIPNSGVRIANLIKKKKKKPNNFYWIRKKSSIDFFCRMPFFLTMCSSQLLMGWLRIKG